MPSYKLSQSLITEGEPVRSLAFTSKHLLSGSESGTLSSIPISSDSDKLLNSEGSLLQPGGEGTRHSHHITALTSIALGSNDDSSFYATGCKDNLIRIFDSETHAQVQTLRGHENAVTALSTLYIPLDNGSFKTILVSGSWDGSAKLWDVSCLSSGDVNIACISTLDGHENTVSVQGLPPIDQTGRLATGSAGIAQNNVISQHKIRIWEITFLNDSVKVDLKHTIAQDHAGPIRDLAYDPTSQMLLSCSNDGTVKVRDAMNGQTVTTLMCPASLLNNAQPPMLLSVDSTGDGKVIAGSEDGNLIIWDVHGSGDDAVQVIPHPNCVWKVLSAVDESNDVLTGCHDGTVRVFSTSDAKVASDAEQSAFQNSVMEARAKTSTGPSAEEIASLPKWEMNAGHIGKSEGQVQVFNKNGKAIAAQWSMASGTWIEVGEVTGRNENAGTIDGVEFDHVFPIEIDLASGGLQKLQIGYNNGENPFTVAQKFIDDYMLDQGYLAQIADYIRSRVGEAAGPTLGMEGAAPMSGDVSSNPVPMDITPTPTPAPSYTNFPMRGYKTFETGADQKVLSKVCNKIREFNSCLNNNLSPNEIDGTLDSLCQTIAATNRYHATTVSDEELAMILKMMQGWSLENVFPSLDLARLVALHPDAAKSSRSMYWDKILACALDRCESLLSSDITGTPKTAIPMLSFRLFANCFRGGVGSQSAVELHLHRILKCVDSFAASTNKNVRLSLSTVLLNASSHMKSVGRFDDAIPDLFLITIGNICGSGIYETEPIVRVLVAFGTALLVDNTFQSKAKAMHMGSMLNLVASQHGEKAGSIVAEISSILQ